MEALGATSLFARSTPQHRGSRVFMSCFVQSASQSSLYLTSAGTSCAICPAGTFLRCLLQHQPCSAAAVLVSSALLLVGLLLLLPHWHARLL